MLIYFFFTSKQSQNGIRLGLKIGASTASVVHEQRSQRRQGFRYRPQAHFLYTVTAAVLVDLDSFVFIGVYFPFFRYKYEEKTLEVN